MHGREKEECRESWRERERERERRDRLQSVGGDRTADEKSRREGWSGRRCGEKRQRESEKEREKVKV